MKLHRLLWNKPVLAILIVAVLVAGFFFWQKERRPTPEQQYVSEVVERGDITQTVSANGTLNPVVLVNVGTQVSGTVKRLLADFNDKVQKGQVLVELDDTQNQTQTQQSETREHNATTTLDLAKANAQRMRDLF